MKLNTLFALALACLSPAAFASGELIVLDSGHTQEFPGSFGPCGSKEAWVNQLVTLKVTRGLQDKGFKVKFTRELIADEADVADAPGTEPGDQLTARGDAANKLKADLMLSIHHDSMPEDGIAQDDSLCPDFPNEDKRIATEEFKQKFHIGFNAFAEDRNPKLPDAIKLATLIAEQLLAAGQKPANFHTPEVEPKSCGSCKFVDESKGVMTRKLGALKNARMPAVLIEVTNLRVPEMEKNALNPAYQQLIADAIVAGVEKYFAPPEKGH
jgi:N-acetylmuramoyl-L-alanine amidase